MSGRWRYMYVLYFLGGGGGSRTEKKLPDTCMITLQYIRYIHTDPRACETCGIWVQWVQRIFYYGSCRTCMYIHSTPLPLPRYIDGLCRFDHTRWTHPRKEEGGGRERKKKAVFGYMKSRSAVNEDRAGVLTTHARATRCPQICWRASRKPDRGAE